MSKIVKTMLKDLEEAGHKIPPLWPWYESPELWAAVTLITGGLLVAGIAWLWRAMGF